MMIRVPITILWMLIFAISCTKKTENYTHTTLHNGENSQEKTLTSANTDYIPTNPTGGKDPKTITPIGAEEHEKRIRINTLAPIILGQSAGNISFDHTYAQGLDILSEHYNSNSNDKNELTYYEGIWVKWGINKLEGRKVQLIRVMDSYQGPLTISPELTVTMGQNLENILDSDEKRIDFTSNLIKLYFNADADEASIEEYFDKKYCAITNYDNGTHSIKIFNTLIFFEKDYKAIAQIIIFTPSEETAPAESLAILENMKEPIDLLQSAAGINFTMNKEQINQTLHSTGSLTTNQEEVFKENIWIKWNQEKITYLRIMEGYLGTIHWPGLGDIAMKQELSPFFQTADKKSELINALYQELYQKDSDYNCFKNSTCRCDEDNPENYSITFYKDDKLSLILFFEGAYSSLFQIIVIPEEEL